MKAAVREIEKRLMQSTDSADRLGLLIELANVHADAFENRAGLRAAREALQISRHRGDALAAGRALSVATLCHYQRGDYVSAVATGLDAVEAYADGDLAGRSNALQSIALALFSVGSLALAESTARRAIDDARASAQPAWEACARGVLGVILAQREDFNAARREFRQACAIYGRGADDVRVKKSAANLGHTYRHQGNAADRLGRGPQARFYWRQALRVYRIALEAGRAAADDAIILGCRAECELRMGEVAAARQSIARALALGVQSPMILAPCYLWESHVLKAMGETKAAESACERARHAAEELEQGDMLVVCLHAQSQLADLQGRFEAAGDLEKRARDVAAERAAQLAQVREQLAPLWNRYTAHRSGNAVRDAA